MMVLENKQGCTITFKSRDIGNTKMITMYKCYPTGNASKELIEPDKAQDTIKDLLVNHAFSVLF